MQTHRSHDHDHLFTKRLEERADEAVAAGASTVAAGRPGEQPLAEWQASNGVHVHHMVDDEQKILRISVGGGDNLPVPMTYTTFRGDRLECIKLLSKAIYALREGPG